MCRCFDQGQILLLLVRVDDGAAAEDGEAAANFGLEVERAQIFEPDLSSSFQS